MCNSATDITGKNLIDIERSIEWLGMYPTWKYNGKVDGNEMADE